MKEKKSQKLILIKAVGCFKTILIFLPFGSHSREKEREKKVNLQPLTFVR